MLPGALGAYQSGTNEAAAKSPMHWASIDNGHQAPSAARTNTYSLAAREGSEASARLCSLHAAPAPYYKAPFRHGGGSPGLAMKPIVCEAQHDSRHIAAFWQR